MDTSTAGNANLAVKAADDALNVRRVFGEAYESDGVLVIPVAKLLGGSGMGFGNGALGRSRADSGRGTNGDATGGGGGFTVRAKPMGVYTVEHGNVRWQPSMDLNRVILGGQITGAAALAAIALIVRKRRRR